MASQAIAVHRREPLSKMKATQPFTWRANTAQARSAPPHNALSSKSLCSSAATSPPKTTATIWYRRNWSKTPAVQIQKSLRAGNSDQGQVEFPIKSFPELRLILVTGHHAPLHGRQQLVMSSHDATSPIPYYRLPSGSACVQSNRRMAATSSN